MFDFLKQKKPLPRRVESIGNLMGGDLGFVVAYFNYCGYQKLRQNMLEFLDRWRWMEGRLLVVELAYGDKPWELSGKATNLLQLRSDSVLWHKEAMINAGTKILRERGFENVGWLDGDVEILGDGEEWYYLTNKALRRRKLVQCFENVEHRYDDDTLRAQGCMAEALAPGADLIKCYKTGLGWAVRGDVWDRCGWFDLGLLGSGDRLAYLAAMPEGRLPDAGRIMQFLATGVRPFLQEWERWAADWRGAIGGSVGYVHGYTMRAHPHGALSERGYYRREMDLQKIGFDPAKDVERDANGLLQWSPTVRPGLPELAKQYFVNRRDDG
jgi:hypothetical protein